MARCYKKKKSQKTVLKETDGREMQEHHKRNNMSTEKTDEDKHEKREGLVARYMCDPLERQQIISTI